MPKAKEAALKALQLDETLSSAHTTLGHIHFNYDWDWDAGEREYERAFELNPNDAHNYGFWALSLMATGKREQAFSNMEQFKKLDPGYFPGNLIRIGLLYYWAHEYDQVIGQMKMLIEMAPNFPNTYGWLGLAYLEKRDFPNAIAALQKALDLSGRAPVVLANLGIAYARAGNTQQAEKILSELLETSKTKYVPEFNIACLYGALGRKDEGFEWLEKAYQERANGVSAIKVYPIINDLRSDPRFTEMLRRLKLED